MVESKLITDLRIELEATRRERDTFREVALSAPLDADVRSALVSLVYDKNGYREREARRSFDQGAKIAQLKSRYVALREGYNAAQMKIDELEARVSDRPISRTECFRNLDVPTQRLDVCRSITLYTDDEGQRVIQSAFTALKDEWNEEARSVIRIANENQSLGERLAIMGDNRDKFLKESDRLTKEMADGVCTIPEHTVLLTRLAVAERDLRDAKRDESDATRQTVHNDGWGRGYNEGRGNFDVISSQRDNLCKDVKRLESELTDANHECSVWKQREYRVGIKFDELDRRMQSHMQTDHPDMYADIESCLKREEQLKADVDRLHSKLTEKDTRLYHDLAGMREDRDLFRRRAASAEASVQKISGEMQRWINSAKMLVDYAGTVDEPLRDALAESVHDRAKATKSTLPESSQTEGGE